MKTGAGVAALPLTAALAFSTGLNAGTIGLTVAGTGVAIGPVNDTCVGTLNCPVLAFSAWSLVIPRMLKPASTDPGPEAMPAKTSAS
jgi:hypothetical protein